MDETLAAIIECADYFIVMLEHKFPGAIASMQFSIKPRPGLTDMRSPNGTPMQETILRGTWVLGIASTCKNGNEINNEGYALAKEIFLTHGVLIQHLIVEADNDPS